jgi:heme A synthase
VGALIVTIAVLASAVYVRMYHASRREIVRPAMLLVVLVAAQLSLGAFVVWSALQPVVNTIHVVNGALVLGTSLVLTLRTYRCGRLTADSWVSTRVARAVSPVTDARGPAGHVGLPGDRPRHGIETRPATEKGSPA